MTKLKSIAQISILLYITCTCVVSAKKPSWPLLAPDPDVLGLLKETTPIFNILQYGAIGDNSTINTVAIQTAIQAAYNAGGGLVMVPPSNLSSNPPIIAFKTATIQLLSNVYLYLPTGSVLHGSSNQSEYVAVSGGNWDHWDVIHTVNATNTGILGDVVNAIDWNHAGSGDRSSAGVGALHTSVSSGILQGPMWQMISSYDPTENQLQPIMWTGPPYNCIGECRPRLVVFEDCENVVLSNIQLLDSADWTSLFRRVRGLTWENVTVWGSQQWPNNDGCDLESVTDAYWNNVNIFSGDDSLCLASGNTNTMLHPWPEPPGNYTPTTNVLVENCVLSSYSSAFKLEAIFQQYHGDIVNVTLRNINIQASNRGIGFQQRTGKGKFQNITFANISIEARAIIGNNWWGLGEGIWLTTLPESTTQGEAGLGGIHDIYFYNISSVSEQGIVVLSRDQGNATGSSVSAGTNSLTNIVFESVTNIIGVLGNATRPGVHDLRPIDVGSSPETQQILQANVSGYWFEHAGGSEGSRGGSGASNVITVTGGGVFFVSADPPPFWMRNTCWAMTEDSLVNISADVDCQPVVGKGWVREEKGKMGKGEGGVEGM